MPVCLQHNQNSNRFYFETFTCYKWLQSFEISNEHDTVYKRFDHLYKKNIYISGYAIMRNHVHLLLYFSQRSKSLNTIINNAKRFMDYEIMRRWKEEGNKTWICTFLLTNKTFNYEKCKIHDAVTDCCNIFL